MSWQLVDAPSHIAPEVGANLLTGAGPWTAPLALDGEYVLTVEVLGGGVVEWVVAGVDGEGLPVTVPGLSETVPDGEWVRVTIPFTAPGFAGDATVTLTVPGESRDPVLGALTGRTVLTVPGDVLAETIMASGGIVAGTPGGARVELAEDGLIAFDASGTETARIQGEGGEFVGGEFRTSDTLPGQVVLSDTGYTHSGTGVARPGIRIDPEDSTGLAAAAGIGPIGGGFEIDGGRSTSGERTSIIMHPGYSLIRADGSLAGKGYSDISVQPELAEIAVRNGAHQGSIQATPGHVSLHATHPDGANAAQAAADTLSARLRAYRTDGSRAGAVEATATTATVSVRDAAGTTRGSMEVSEAGAISRSFSGNASESGWVRARPQDAELAYVDANNTYFSRIKADASEAFIYTRAGGTTRYLTVDADGVWVQTNVGGAQKSYNLEETAQDSGWQSITPDAGHTGSASFAWRNKGGVIWYRGTVTATWTAGWNTIATLPAEVHPEYAYTVNEAGTSAGVLIRTQVDGRLELYAPTAGTSTHRFTSLSYPVG